jgi:hypothetical protein
MRCEGKTSTGLDDEPRDTAYTRTCTWCPWLARRPVVFGDCWASNMSWLIARHGEDLWHQHSR